MTYSFIVTYTIPRCMNHKKDLDYIPQLPLSVKTLVFVNNYLPHINRQTFVNVSSNDINHLNLTQNRIQTGNVEMLLSRKKCNRKSRKTNRYFYHDIFIYSDIHNTINIQIKYHLFMVFCI
jgi:hypothetical protein